MYMMFCGVDGKLPAFKMDLAVALKGQLIALFLGRVDQG